MDSYKCPMCNQKAIEPINLRCDHHPCFQCASQIITVDHERYFYILIKYPRNKI
jgi:deoxycytidylate deaminase